MRRRRNIFIDREQPRIRVGGISLAHALLWGVALAVPGVRSLIVESPGFSVLTAISIQGTAIISALMITHHRRRNHNSLAKKNFGPISYML